jgi:flavodoxin
MKSLVVFYSRSGNTKKVGEKIAKILKADIDEIVDLKDRTGIIGWLNGGRDILFKNATKIKNKLNPLVYQRVIIGTPIWVGTMAPAVKAYFNKYNLKKVKQVVFFSTAGDKQTWAFKNMEEASKKPLATLDIKDKNIESSDKEIKEFCNKIIKN